MFIIRHRQIFFALTGALVAAAIIAFLIFGLRVSIDFTGGTLAQVSYSAERPPVAALQASLDKSGFSGYSLREAGESDYILRAGSMTNEQRQNLQQTLSVGNQYP